MIPHVSVMTAGIQKEFLQLQKLLKVICKGKALPALFVCGVQRNFNLPFELKATLMLVVYSQGLVPQIATWSLSVPHFLGDF